MKAVLLSIIPGVGLIHRHKVLRGLLIFAAFIFCLNGALLAPFIFPEDGRLSPLFLTTAALLWLAAALHSFLRLHRRRRKPAPVRNPDETEQGP